MSDGLKQGAGTNPFGNGGDDDDQDDVEPDDAGSADDDRVDEDTESDTQEIDSEQQIPYVLRRSEVKQGREDTNFALREGTKERESDFQDAVEEAVGTDVYLTDVREAAYCYAMEHPEKVAELLLGWGYEHRV